MGRRALVIGYVAAAVAVTALVAVDAEQLARWPVAGAVALLLAAVGYVGLRSPRPLIEAYPRWRNLMPCYLSVQDRDLRILEVNDLFRQDLGNGVGEHCYAVYKHRDLPCPNCPVLKTFADAGNHSSEETVVTLDGRVARVTVVSTPLLDRHGKPVAAVLMSTPVNAATLLERELEQSRQHFQQLFDIVPCYITIHDRSFRIIESNELFRRDFGECRGARCYRAYKGRAQICADCPVEKTFADGQIHSSEETVVTKDGLKAAVIVYSTPILDDAGEIVAVMEVSTNITRVKELQSELAMVGLAVSGMAHRIKNVMMGLEGGIFVVNTGFEDDDTKTLREGWDMVQRNVVKVSRIARDLLFCSKERAANPVPETSPSAIVEEVFNLFSPRAHRDGIDLQLHMADGDDRGTYDPDGVNLLISNLISNAIDACRFDTDGVHKRHVITVRCSTDEVGDAVIEVADNGAGIPSEDSDKVFQRFFSSKGTEGTGLGLFVVQRVVQQHRGSITFETEQGGGTTFRAVLRPLPGP